VTPSKIFRHLARQNDWSFTDAIDTIQLDGGQRFAPK
jgi:hypothetical protein